jgi:uncharacterized caspase-like protein
MLTDLRTGLAGGVGKVVILLLCLVVLPVAAQSIRFKEARSALVIGNADYASARLRTPTQDAKAINDKLVRLGFKVRMEENATQRTMLAAFRNYIAQAERQDVRLIYFAGHGVQWRGRNYLVPVDIDIQREEDLINNAVDLTEVIERLSNLRQGVNIVIVDACRDNPFVSGVARLADARRIRTRSLASKRDEPQAGLAEVQVSNSGTVIAFSTSPGSLASDGNGARHSIYTKHLLDHIERPGQTIEKMLKQVRIGVSQETNFAQIPWETSSLMGEFCFKTAARGVCGD